MAGGDGLSTTHPRGRAPWRGLSALLVALAVAGLAPALLGDEVRRALSGLRPFTDAPRDMAQARP